ncbi:MAG TPA: IS1595 family transposase [Gaiellaceae bacterium]|nr:IS1595 family transposase [Gaiellaceae bacterium]
MAPVDRKNPKRAASSESSFSLMEFMREFPDDEACLLWLWRTRFAPDGENAYCPTCGVIRKFRRYEIGKQAWTCTSCSKRLTPTAGTIFHKSSTSLQLWFYAMWLMTSTRCGVSAKQLERELGVTYKTAWRMFNLIRNKLMTQDDEGPLSGELEADETWHGGKMRASDRRKAAAKGVTIGPHAKPRATVFGIVERGGRVVTMVVPSRYDYTLRSNLRQRVGPGASVYTDDYSGYNGLRQIYTHHTINHTGRIYAEGHVHTQTIEGFFSLFKNGVRGVYHPVSVKWLEGYLNEHAWRYNHRDDREAMFRRLLKRAALSA